MRKYVVIVFAVLLGVIAFLMYSVRSLHQDRERLENNQTALLEDVEYYKTESGNYAASVQALELTKKELSQHCQELTETIEDLNLKIKRIEAVSATATETNIPIETEVTDSIVYRVNTDRLVPVPVIRDTLMAIRYKDPWVELNGIVNRGVFKGNIHTVDTLYQVVHRVPYQWWFFKWGTKAIRQEIKSSNPYTTIVYAEYIELARRCKKKSRL